MPICNKQAAAAASTAKCAEIDDHASEAAKVRRTRDQAYFNSYNFDAIEILPYNDVDDVADAVGGPGVAERVGAAGHPGDHHQHHQLKDDTVDHQHNNIEAITDYYNNNNNNNNNSISTANYVKSPTTTTTTTTLQNYTLKSKQQNRHSDYRKPSSLSSSQSSSRSSATSSSASVSECSSSRQATSVAATRPNGGAFVNKLSYLQRLGILFGGGVAANEQRAAKDGGASEKTTTARLPQQASENVEHHATLVGVTEATAASVTATTPPPPPPTTTTTTTTTATATSKPANNENADGNFLLPRAMLKYQSVAAPAHSMPLAVITTTPSTHVRSSSKFVPHAYQSYHYNNTSASSHIVNGNGSAAQKVAPGKPAAATKLNYVTVKVAAPAKATPIIPTTAALATRHKKTSTSSSIGTSIASIAEEEDDDGGNNDNGVATVTIAAATAQPRMHVRRLESSKPATESPNAVKVPCKTGTTAKAKRVEECEKTRGRANSHQSHYSTEKSGSSGYYSSNVCSTYSMEDHIYCEPVIDVVRDRNVGAGLAGKPLGGGGGGGVKAVSAGVGEAVSAGGGAGKDLCSVQQQASALALEASALAKRGARQRQHFTEHLRILETSIENLDRHLKRYPGLTSQDRIASFAQSHTHLYLPTIVEASPPPAPAWSGVGPIDDSLLDIDLDSFLLVNERKGSQRLRRLKMRKANGGGAGSEAVTGIDNPSFLTEEQEENHRKCANYINSCPEDAYRVESDIVAEDGTAASEKSSLEPVAAHYPKRYEDQLHFESTRELLQDVRDKIRLLSRSSSSNESGAGSGEESNAMAKEILPKELEGMIRTLKYELECYLARMNQHSELEIRQLCTGLVKRDNIVRMQKAFERRRSSASLSFSVHGAPEVEPNLAASTYEVIRDVHHHNHHHQLPPLPHAMDSIRSASDPNFKLKRKSLAELFPPTVVMASTHARSITPPPPPPPLPVVSGVPKSQIQRNLSFHQPVLQQLDVLPGSSIAVNVPTTSGISSAGARSGSGSGDFGEKDSILEWHRKKPSIWEMYYGTNRMNQSLLGKRNALSHNPSGASGGQPTMSYPSSRPESDFTLDLPRAEQLRIKMEKEKKFRQRCRYITTFLSLVFFLLTVMVVSLVLTRGKRMFGSMI